MKIPTQKEEHSCKCTELSLKWKEGIVLIQSLNTSQSSTQMLHGRL